MQGSRKKCGVRSQGVEKAYLFEKKKKKKKKKNCRDARSRLEECDLCTEKKWTAIRRGWKGLETCRNIRGGGRDPSAVRGAARQLGAPRPVPRPSDRYPDSGSGSGSFDQPGHMYCDTHHVIIDFVNVINDISTQLRP